MQDLGALEDRLAISDEIANAKLTIAKKEMGKRKGNLEKLNTTLRDRLQESTQREFIIELGNPHE